MVPLEVSYLGGLRCRVVHGPSGQVIMTDAPKDNHGRGEFFSPTDLIATGLATCVATIMGIVAEREHIDLTRMMIHVEKEMVSVPVRRIGRISVTVEMPAGLTDDQKRTLEAAALNCPVHKSLPDSVDQRIVFKYASE